jgi:hypothetical protein
MPTPSIARPSNIYPNWDFWFEKNTIWQPRIRAAHVRMCGLHKKAVISVRKVLRPPVVRLVFLLQSAEREFEARENCHLKKVNMGRCFLFIVRKLPPPSILVHQMVPISVTFQFNYFFSFFIS